MIEQKHKELRVLAVNPVSRGFGFVVLEGANRLIDWGTRSARKNKKQECLRKFSKLSDGYQPDVLVLENCAARGARRCARVCQLIDAMAAFATERKIRVRRFSRKQVQAAFDGAQSKHAIATIIAERFPELAPILPPPRRFFESEAHAMAFFDAAALAVTLYRVREKPQGMNAISETLSRTVEL